MALMSDIGPHEKVQNLFPKIGNFPKFFSWEFPIPEIGNFIFRPLPRTILNYLVLHNTQG